MATLGLAMIVRNEEKTLGRCLQSVHGCFDEVVIVDTGSTDRTKEIAMSFGAMVFDFQWIDDFAAARNFSFSKVNSDYVMWLDADDVLKPEDRDRLQTLRYNLGQADAYLMLYNYAQDEYGQSTGSFYRHRILRNSKEARWKYPIHECLIFPHQTWKEAMTNVVVTHMRSEAELVQDHGRNLKLLRKAAEQYPDDQRMKFYFAKELINDGKAEEAVKIFEEYLQKGDWHENRVNALLFLAIGYWKLGKEDKAIETCLKGIHFDPRWAEYYCTIGQIYYNRGDWPKAAQWFEMAALCKLPESWGLTLRDNYTWVPHDRLCKCYAEMKDFRRACAENEKALKFRPNDSRMLFNREYLRDTLFPGRLAERPIRLSLGGGAKPVQSYRNCDLFPGQGIEEAFDQCEIPYRDGVVHAIYSEHSLEHAPSHEASRATIAEWARVLRHNGTLTLKVPDLDLCCEAFLREEDREARDGETWSPKDWYRYTIYGIQKPQGSEPAEGQYHRTGFTKSELRRLLSKNGFEIRNLRNYDGWGTPSIEVQAVRKGAPIKVRWLFSTINEDDPSCRIRRMNVHRWLKTQGVDSVAVTEYREKVKNDAGIAALVRELKDADVVVMCHFGEGEAKLIERLRRCGVSVVMDGCEDLDGYDYQRECFQAVSVVECCSTVLAKKFEKYGRTRVIPDAYELPAEQTGHSYEAHGKDGKIRVVWCGMGGNAVNLDPLRPIIQELGMELAVISEWDNADIKWNRKTWLRDLSNADIVLAPQRPWLQPAKSNNKVTQAQALGMPVVASPLQAYREAIDHGKTGFICETVEDWKTYLTMLRDDASLRERIGRAAQVEVRKKYAIDVIGAQWIELLESLCEENCAPPKVDIIVPTYNNLKYLKECVASIRKNTDWPYNIIVVNSGTDETAKWLQRQPDVIYYNSPERLHFSEANNVGLQISKERYVCLLNDDTIVGKHWLSALMHEAMKPGVGAVGPFSNCDRGWLHDEAVVVGGVSLVPGMTLEDVASVKDKIQDYAHPKSVRERDWVAFYCTLIPREVVEKVGILDQGFKSGCEDLDYCKRIKTQGYRVVQTYDSWVFHFGGKTRKNTEISDFVQHHEEDRANHALLKAKYEKPIFVLYTGPAWEQWSPKSVNEGGIGGSETCAVYVAREFAKRGYRSVVFSDCAGLEGEYDGVVYQDYRKFQDFISQNYAEIFVSSRIAGVFGLPIRAGYKICWVHDIWLSQDQNAEIHKNRVDKFYVLSPWHLDFFSRHHRVGREKLHVTRDGVDLDRFREKPPREKGRLIYSSSPDRGLDTLLEVFPRIRAEIPEASLHVFYGFANWEKAIRARNDQGQLAWMERLKGALQQPGVVYHDRVGQARLAQEFLKSELWAYPTWFTETFCITAAEAMAAGLPIITTDLAALSTTVGDTGILLPGDCRSKEYKDRFVAECVLMLKDPDRWKEYSERSLARVKEFSWSTFADEWLQAIEQDKKRKSPGKLVEVA